jgi:hypothetical protein
MRSPERLLKDRTLEQNFTENYQTDESLFSLYYLVYYFLTGKAKCAMIDPF